MTQKEDEIEAMNAVKRALLLMWVIFKFPKDNRGMYMAKAKLLSILDKIYFADVEAWQKDAQNSKSGF